MEFGTAEAHRITGVPRRTIIDWASKAGVIAQAPNEKMQAARIARMAVKREEMRELLLDRAVDLLERLGGPSKAADTKHVATAAAILIDKYRLEMGEATARTYHEGSDDIDRRVAQLVAEMGTRSEATPS